MDANRRNASQSTGPRTDEGKERSRANAVTHGLTSKFIIPQEMEAAQNQRYEGYAVILRPEDTIQEQQLEQAALASLRVEHCQACEIDRRTELASIAADWPSSHMAANR